MRWLKPSIFASAFTLMELMVAISITGILFLSAVPGYRSSLVTTQFVILKKNAASLSKKYLIYKMAHGRTPEMPWFVEESVSPWRSARESSYLMKDVFLPSFLQSIPTDYVLDPFAREDTLDGLYYVPQYQIKALFEISSWRFTGSHSRRDRFLVSRGPDREIEKISSPACCSRILYDVSNGIESRGDILLSFPSNKACFTTR